MIWFVCWQGASAKEILLMLGCTNPLFVPQPACCPLSPPTTCDSQSKGHLKDISQNPTQHCVTKWSPEGGVYPNRPMTAKINTDAVSDVWENSLYLLPPCRPDNPGLIHKVQSWITTSAPPTIAALWKLDRIDRIEKTKQNTHTQGHGH